MPAAQWTLALGPAEWLYLGYILANAALILGFFGWFFVRLEKIVASNGSFDIYLNLITRLLPWQVGLFLIYFAAERLFLRAP